jgi:hypothetical protein
MLKKDFNIPTNLQSLVIRPSFLNEILVKKFYDFTLFKNYIKKRSRFFFFFFYSYLCLFLNLRNQIEKFEFRKVSILNLGHMMI